MKLYTEEQVKRAIDISDDNADLLEYNEILSKLTPIELPSDEEIDNELPNNFDGNYVCGFYEGVDYVREHIIKQQDNGR